MEVQGFGCLAGVRYPERHWQWEPGLQHSALPALPRWAQLSILYPGPLSARLSGGPRGNTFPQSQL